MIDEASRRWDDFRGGTPIELPDGQTWWFHEPQGRTRLGVPGWTFGADVPADVDAILSNRLGRILAKLPKATEDADRASVALEAAWFLLARNYAVTPEEFEEILGGAAEWNADRQQALAESFLMLVGVACARSTALAEAT